MFDLDFFDGDDTDTNDADDRNASVDNQEDGEQGDNEASEKGDEADVIEEQERGCQPQNSNISFGGRKIKYMCKKCGRTWWSMNACVYRCESVVCDGVAVEVDSECD